MSSDDLVKKIEQANRILFILCGYPYAGKSHVARQLVRETGASLVSIDTIFKEHGFDWDSNILPDTDAWAEIFDEAHKQVREALFSGKNVLYDSTNQTLESRDRLREVAQSVDANTFVVYLKTNEEAVWKRWGDNLNNPSRPVVDRKLVEQTIAMFEPPTEAENLIIIDN